ncbi:hypothetical protein [Thermotoga sp. KOL6]|uniref:hypothetical protein n=1 Tax=Thermotoga sp. KOL6 TaxID=126741 RepID=UPI000C774AA8|nr:hypothetical protein [Thermotoga sp. KOL6]PLV59489.1 hypothetical protein AS005_07040 [Thermotoga sp. KOL6]
MRELLVLLRYAFPNGKRGLYSTFVSIVATGTLFYPLLGKPFELLLEEYGEAAFINSLAFSTTLFSIMFILGISFYLSHSLILETELEFLLTLPFKRRTIITYQLLVSLFYQSFTLIIILLNFVMFSLLLKDWIALISGIVHVFVLFLSGSVLALLFGRLMTNTIARRLSSFVQLVAILGFLTLANVPSFAIKLGKIFVSAWNPLAYPFLSHYKPHFVIYEFLLIVLVFTVFESLAKKFAFEPVVSRRKSPVKENNSFSIGKGFFKKDLITLLREERTVYLLLYPVGFGMLMTIIGNTDFGLIFAAGISALYNSTMSGMLLRRELEVWPFPKTLPLRLREIMTSKVVVPSLLNFAIISAYVLFVTIYKAQPLYLCFIPVFLSLYLFVSSFGLLLSKKEHKGQLTNPAKVFSTPKILLIQLMVFGVIALLSYTLESARNVFLLTVFSLIIGSTVGFVSIFNRFIKWFEKSDI